MITLAAIVLAQTISISRQVEAEPAPVTKAHDEVAAMLSSDARAKLDKAAASLGAKADTKSAVKAIGTAFPGTELGPAEVDALTVYLLSEATLPSEKDLRAIMDEAKKIGEQKEALHKQLTAAGVKPDVSVSKAAAVIILRVPEPLAADATPDQMQKRLDDLSSLGQLAVAKAQEVGARRTRTFDTLATLVKKMGKPNADLLASLK